MNTKVAKTIAALSIIAVLAGISPAAVPLAEKVPENTMIYVGWSGQSLTFKGSMFGQLLDEPGIKKLFGTIKTAATNAMKKGDDPDNLANFDSLWAMGSIVWKKPVAVALLDVNMPRKPGDGAAADGPNEPMPEGFILIDLAKDKAAFDAHLQKLLVLIGKEHKLAQITVGNLSCHSFVVEGSPVSLGYVGNIFFASIGKGVPRKIASVVNGKSRSLANSAKFKTAMKEVAGQNVQLAYYADVPRLLKIAEKLTPSTTTAPAGQNEFGKIIKAMGIDGVTAIAGASNIVDRGFYEKCRIFSPAPHRGILMAAAGKPLGPAAMNGIPADADYVAAINLDPVKALNGIKRISDAIDPNAGKQFDKMLAEACKQLGMDVEKDLMAHMGDQWTLVSAPSLGGTFTGTAAMVQLKDAAKFSAALVKIEEQLAKAITAKPKEEGEPEEPRGFLFFPKVRVKPGIRKYKSGEIEVHYIAMPGNMPIPVAPAWAVHKGKFYIAAFPQVVAALAEGTTQKPLAQSATFASFRKRMSPNASAISYTNTPSLVRRFYGVVLLGGTAATNMLGDFAPSIKPEVLPPLPRVEKYLWPQITAISSDAKGITIESYGSMPSYITSWMNSITIQSPVMATSLAVSILLPTLAKAKIQAKQAISGANLNGIGKSCLIYMCDNDDQFPPDLAKLIEEGYLPAEMLISPNSGRKIRKDSKGKPIPPFDYVYLGAGLKDSAPGGLILAYERPEINKNKGTNVLYVDFHVKWCAMEEFERDLAKTKKWIRENNK